MGLAELGDALERAVGAAEELGIDTADARSVAADLGARDGYPADLYVLALAGGTGVGKSSLLNAIAGCEVSLAGIRRPTTSTPVAWVPAGLETAARPLLEWLGGAEVRTHPGDGPAVAVVDLPDLDSIEPAHAERVDAILPRVDAVLWVTDPEKYDDAVLHDRYLRRWMPRLARQAVVINKGDRLSRSDGERVREDLRARLAGTGLPTVPVLLASAARDAEPVRAWLVEGASAKEIVTARLRSSASDAARTLGRAAGVVGMEPPAPLVPPEARERTVAASTRALLDVVDLEGLSRQAVAATRGTARSSGGDPLGAARSLLERGSGVSERRADPEGYLRRWRERGSLDRAVGPIRHVLADRLETLPPGIRPTLAAAMAPAGLGERLASGVDRVVSGPAAHFPEPRSRVWPLIGVGQLLATAAVVAGVLWLITLWVAGAPIPTPSVEVPVLGSVPTPAVLILAGLLGWFLLGRLLAWHAGRLGRGWAEDLRRALQRQVYVVATETLDELVARPDAARHAIWRAMRDIDREGGPERGQAQTGRAPRRTADTLPT